MITEGLPCLSLDSFQRALCRPALALTIATGTPEGTYYQIAVDIKQIG
jgi:TRAP-type uncharacterized transport system substrate-binding protein